MTRLCIAVDDFGLHEGVNRAALRLADQGRVHAVGALVGAPVFGAGASALRRLDAQGVDVGLHLDFTETPLLRRSCRRLRELVASSFVNALDRRLVRNEIAAQLDAFEAALGHGPACVEGNSTCTNCRAYERN